ncbi:hypothetical protein GGR92_002057 [Spirosoma lacussanchae]
MISNKNTQQNNAGASRHLTEILQRSNWHPRYVLVYFPAVSEP